MNDLQPITCIHVLISVVNTVIASLLIAQGHQSNRRNNNNNNNRQKRKIIINKKKKKKKKKTTTIMDVKFYTMLPPTWFLFIGIRGIRVGGWHTQPRCLVLTSRNRSLIINGFMP